MTTSNSSWGRAHAWRLALVASGAAMVSGGRMHPDADAEDSLREELATMTADDRWVTGHSLIVLSTLLLATGLWLAHRRGAWPGPVRRRLQLAATVISVYAVETVFHLAAVVDSDALRHGDVAPVAFTHVALSVLLYPLSGGVIALLALSMGRAWGDLRWGVAVLGMAGGVVHAVSVPVTLLLPDLESTPLFAGGALLIAAWSVGTGLAGASGTRAVQPEARAPQAVS